MCFGENTHYREQKFKAAACAEHSNHFRAASSLSVQLKPMNVSSWLKRFSYKPFTVQTRDKLPHPKILLGLLWKGLGGRGLLGEGTSPQPLHKHRGAGLTAAGAGVGWEQQTRPLQPGRSEALPRWGRGSEVPGQAQAQLKHGSGRPALKAAPRGKGGKASHRFPTNLIPGYTAPPFQSWAEHWELTPQRRKELGRFLVHSGCYKQEWKTMRFSVKTGKVGAGEEAIKRNTQEEIWSLFWT